MLSIKKFKHTHSPGNLADVRLEFWASRSQWYISSSGAPLYVSPSVSLSLLLYLQVRDGSSGWGLLIETTFLCVNEGLWVCDRSCCQLGEKQDVTQLDLSPILDSHSEPFPCQRQHKPGDHWIHAPLFLSSPKCRPCLCVFMVHISLWPIYPQPHFNLFKVFFWERERSLHSSGPVSLN